MSSLSEVTILFGERAGEIEKARSWFTSETRSFVTTVLSGLGQLRPDPWTAGRVRIELPDEIDKEAKATSSFGNQFASARCHLRFKKQTKFVVVADVPFGIQYDEGEGAFRWRVVLVPTARYWRLDDVIWQQWRAREGVPPSAAHDARKNTIQFVSRALGKELTIEQAFDDVKTVFDFLLNSDEALADAVGVDLSADEAAAAD